MGAMKILERLRSSVTGLFVKEGSKEETYKDSIPLWRSALRKKAGEMERKAAASQSSEVRDAYLDCAAMVKGLIKSYEKR